jgi:hypothetical protein
LQERLKRTAQEKDQREDDAGQSEQADAEPDKRVPEWVVDALEVVEDDVERLAAECEREQVAVGREEEGCKQEDRQVRLEQAQARKDGRDEGERGAVDLRGGRQVDGRSSGTDCAVRAERERSKEPTHEEAALEDLDNLLAPKGLAPALALAVALPVTAVLAALLEGTDTALGLSRVLSIDDDGPEREADEREAREQPEEVQAKDEPAPERGDVQLEVARERARAGGEDARLGSRRGDEHDVVVLGGSVERVGQERGRLVRPVAAPADEVDVDRLPGPDAGQHERWDRKERD